MRITHISDTHNHHAKLQDDLPGGDLLIHSGDFSSIGRRSEIERFIKWFNNVDNYTYKVFIAGNHDLTFESEALHRQKSQWFDGPKAYDTAPGVGKPYWLCEILEVGLGQPLCMVLENQSMYIQLMQTIYHLMIWKLI